MDYREELSKIIEETTKRHWEESGEPLLLSSIPQKLTLEYQQVYKNVITDVYRLKNFIDDSSKNYDYKIVVHEKEKAKIGLIPKNAEYKFIMDGIHENKKQKNLAISLIEIISKLTEDDINKIEIPVYVIVKLYNLK